MNFPRFPSITASPGRTETLILEDGDDISDLARQLIDGHHVGILATVDASGFPHLCWMATLSCDEFPRIVTLTAPNSRKVENIRRHPQVNWMFSNDDLTLVLNLTGAARILDDTKSIKHAWQLAKDKSRAYFLNNFAKKPGMVVIETMVERFECVQPQCGFKLCKTVPPTLPG